jgi:hypothetical protein
MKILSPMSLAIAVLLAGGASILAAERVAVRGSANQYDTRIKVTNTNRPNTLVLTGAGMRKRVFFSIYTIASYVQEGMAVRSAEDLIAADCPKRLHLIMERDVEGQEMADAIISSLRSNHPAPAFSAEVTMLNQMLRAQAVKRGDHVWLTHVPKAGLQVDLVGKRQFLVESIPFSRAIWEIYLGRNPVSEPLKRALLSLLPPRATGPRASP